MDRIGSYAVVRELGAGGMGTVYLARSRGGRLLAVKVARPELAADTAFRARFRVEVEAARRVGGFHTAQVVDADPDGEPPWLATAYVPGPTLAHLIAAEGPMAEGELRQLGAALAEALQAVHGCGLVHRDLKPGNIIMAPDGPRVVDFGIARAVESTRLTITGHAFGTPGYLAPEQAEGREVTGAADVFALGAVLVAAAGGSAFGEGTPMMLMYRSVHAEADLSPVPEGIYGIVGACLEKDPARRPTTEQLLDAFTGVVDASHPPTLVVPPPTLVAMPTEDRLGEAQELTSEDAEFFHAEDDERAMVIDAYGAEIRLLGPNGISIDFPWSEIASIGHALEKASLRCTLFIECTDDVPYDCTLTAPDDVTYDRWARHLPYVLNHYCD
ncbi:serine/threonine-protein kinase [Streptomyces rubellomurinus]|uniref:serine/threonine-protein kinase n=1 Tax=Streptomyces rubellomurinus (strain ATCC 31215) TaxID=359131 RepID=UPI00099D22BC|nr:serine/threonine-protein kinase [Streptomyces rubellomurinus]